VPLQDRECGECNACCNFLLIDDPPVRKLPNVLCEHWNGCCKIYDARPNTCREFLCGWRLSSNFAENWRPDQSNILVRVLSRQPKLSVVFHLLAPLTENVTVELLHAIGAMIVSGNEVFLAVAGGPGENALRFSLGPAMAPSIASRNVDHARAVLDAAIRECTTRPRQASEFGAPENT
jgi:hypothetical protein